MSGIVLNKVSRKEIRTFQNALGKAILNERRGRKMTLEKLSRSSGLRPKTLDAYELGKRRIQIDVLACIAKALKVDITALLGKVL